MTGDATGVVLVLEPTNTIKRREDCRIGATVLASSLLCPEVTSYYRFTETHLGPNVEMYFVSAVV
jgi:hypothetical protein